MAAAVDDRAQAAEYYELARDELEKLSKQFPDDLSYARALGACQAQLANLATDGDQSQVVKSYDAARRTFESLATHQKDDTQSQIEWLEAELNSATASGYASGQQRLQQADRIKETLHGQWPTDPTALYQLACFLTGEDVVLTGATAESPAAESRATNPTSR
jgi:hypothetical protein